MQIQGLLAVTLLTIQGVLTYASWGNIAGYAPGSKVTDHNAIDLDQKALQNALGAAAIDYTLVGNIYAQGGNSKAYAEFTVPGLTTALSKSDAVVGATSGVEGKIYSNYATGATTIKVAYKTSEVQATYATCKVGALQTVPAGTTAAATQPYQLLTNCFQNENLQVTTGGSTVTITPTGAPTNKAGRTLKGFSTKAGGTMYTLGSNGGCSGASDRATDGCPYHDFLMYYNYYGSLDYADKFVSAAINGQATAFGNSAGDMDFTGTSDSLRKECIKKGTAYMNAYMYAIREFEDAIDDCKAGCTNGIVGSGANCNSLSTSSVHAWDEGVAFYTGSREGAAVGGNSNGVLFYRLAEKRCANYKTCGANHDSTSGTSYVNLELFRQLSIGAHSILLGQCEAARPVLRKMVALMATPLIQGTLRYAYKLDKLSGGDKERGEGAVFAAAVVPRVAYCSSSDAATIMNAMKVGAASTSFAAVKTAFENNYACLNITCEEVGGLWFPAENKYYDGAEPCVTNPITPTQVLVTTEKMPVWALALIVGAGVCACSLLCGCFWLCYKESQTGKPQFYMLKDGHVVTVGKVMQVMPGH
jgi:hypothetical protein